jgi:putative DNA primase/helicase
MKKRVYTDVVQMDHPAINFPVMIPAARGQQRPSTKHVENTAALLDAYQVEVRYNLMRHALELKIPGFSPDPERAENATAEFFKSLAVRNGLNSDTSVGHLQIVADAYHPVRDWILETPWDGVDRLQDFFATIVLDDERKSELSRILLTRWLVSAVRAVLPDVPGMRKFTPQGVLTFQGPQGIGKTEWFKSLAPSDKDWICTGRVVDPHNRDSIQQVTSFWLSELGELDATFKKSDVVALKAFITQFEDVYRSAYATHAEKIPRRTMMAASVNPKVFLADETGNRRWWVLAVKRLQWGHGIEMQQLWAQVAQMVEQGERWWLDEREMRMLNESNTDHEIGEPIVEDLHATWKPALHDANTQVRVTMNQIWEALPGRSGSARQRRESNLLMQELQKMGVVNDSMLDGNRTFRVELRNPPMAMPSTPSYSSYAFKSYKD